MTNSIPELVSIIVPIYNVDRFLNRCISSIVNQEYKNLEIILVDDGSTDLSAQISDEWMLKDSRIVTYHKANGGLSDARNYGIERANGSYIFFVDSDDWIEPNMISIMLDSLITESADIVCCGIKKVYEDEHQETWTALGNKVYNREEALNEYVNGNRICTVAWNKLYKKYIFEELRYPKGKLNEDEFITYKALLMANKVVFIESPFYCYFQRNNSIMANGAYSNMDIIDALRERTHYFLKYDYEKLALDSYKQAISIILKSLISNRTDKNSYMKIKTLLNDCTCLKLAKREFQMSLTSFTKLQIKIFFIKLVLFKEKLYGTR